VVIAELLMDQSFGRDRRVRKRAQYRRIYDEGAKVHGRSLTLFVRASGQAATRLGVTATRRLGGAVERNRAKRRIREVFRRVAPPDGLDIIVIPRRAALAVGFRDLEADYQSTLRRAIARLGVRNRVRPDSP